MQKVSYYIPFWVIKKQREINVSTSKQYNTIQYNTKKKGFIYLLYYTEKNVRNVLYVHTYKHVTRINSK